MATGRHDAHFYEDALSLAQRVAQHLRDALVAGGGAIALARAEHLAMFERVLADPKAPRTPDLGGKASTAELGRAIAAAI